MVETLTRHIRLRRPAVRRQPHQAVAHAGAGSAVDMVFGDAPHAGQPQEGAR